MFRKKLDDTNERFYVSIRELIKSVKKSGVALFEMSIDTENSNINLKAIVDKLVKNGFNVVMKNSEDGDGDKSLLIKL